MGKKHQSWDVLCGWYEQHAPLIVGVDEVGRGPLAGPVVAAAVVLDARPFPGVLRDSKRLSPKQRKKLSEIIWSQALAVGIGEVSPERIDAINILQAIFEAMVAAVRQVQVRLVQPLLGALIDGNQTVPALYPLKQHAIVGGDDLCAPIMAASIVAKVYRDALMEEACKTYPGYGFAQHKGYGTKQHRDALMRLGPSTFHRHSFEPIRSYGVAQLF